MNRTIRFNVRNDVDKAAARFMHELLAEDPSRFDQVTMAVTVVGRPTGPRPTTVRCPSCGQH